MNLVVARFLDGRMLKGHTNDFLPAKDRFHLLPEDAKTYGSAPLEILIRELKALFFVKDLKGDSVHAETNAFDPSKATPGKKLKVTFMDGEVLVGTTQGYQPDRPGFFLVPADPRSNNERCFVVMNATKLVEFVWH